MAVPITTEAELATYLETKQIPFQQITMLSGGFTNFTFAIEDAHGELSVIKHAESYVKAQTSWEIGTARMDCEARALQTLPKSLPNGGSVEVSGLLVRMPTIYSYDADAHVIHESYGGPHVLKAAYPETPAVDVQAWSRAVAYWAANLHLSTKTTELGDVSWATRTYRHIYNGLAGVLEKHGLDKELGVRINEKYGSLLTTDNQNVCHGDFWSGNLILSKDGKAITVGDWEMARRGNGATDVGQYSAEAHILDRFRGGKDMLNPFLKAYKEKVKVDREFAVRIAVHCCTHLIYWPSWIEWLEKGQIRSLANEAYKVLVMAEKQDWQGLRKCFLGEVFSDV